MLRWWYTSRYTRCRKGREVHKMEDEITRSDLTLNSTHDHVLADFLSDILLHLVNLLVFLVDLVLHLVHLPVLYLVHPPPPNHHPTSPQQPWPTLLSLLAPKGVKILKERFFWDTLYTKEKWIPKEDGMIRQIAKLSGIVWYSSKMFYSHELHWCWRKKGG